MTCYIAGDRIQTNSTDYGWDVNGKVNTISWSTGTVQSAGCDGQNMVVRPDGWDVNVTIACTSVTKIDDTTPAPEPIPEPVIPGDTIIIPGEEYDPCEGVICDDVCADGSLYDQICDDGICIRGVLIESNSPTCPGYIAPVAKGRIDTLSWQACHTRAGCRTDIAYWGSEVTVTTAFTNVGNDTGEFKTRLTNKSDNTVLGESTFTSVLAGASDTVDVVFVMPSTPSLSVLVELIRNV